MKGNLSICNELICGKDLKSRGGRRGKRKYTITPKEKLVSVKVRQQKKKNSGKSLKEYEEK